MIALIDMGPLAAFWTPILIACAGVVGSLVWICHLGHLIRHRHQFVFLTDCPVPVRPDLILPDDPAWPQVALIFAARDEAAGIEPAVQSMLAEAGDDPNLGIIAVNDRSTDGTGAILDRLAAENAALEVVSITDLPVGWLGKTNALQAGANSTTATSARWLLFTDADVVFQPGAIRRAVLQAELMRVDHLVVGPGVETRSTGERTFLALFGLLFSLYGPIGRLIDRRSRAHIGVGAFNLIRAESFRAVGGFQHLAMSVDDDMRLGQTLKYAGYAMGLRLGTGAISVRWQDGTWGMVQGIEKNFFAGLKFQLRRAFIVALGLIVVGIAPFAGLCVGPWITRIIAALGVLSLMVMLGGSRRQSEIAWYYAFLFPIATLLILIALVRSVALTYWRGGIVWRNHRYRLSELKAHVRERDQWLNEVWRSTR